MDIPSKAGTAWHSIAAYIGLHKMISIVVVIVALWGGWYAYGAFTAPSTAARYITTTVATGTVVATMSETGQVSASSNIDVQSKSGGEVLSLPVTAGQHVGAGAALAYIDPTTAQQNVLSAKRALQSAQLSLASAMDSYAQSRDTGYSDVSAAFLALPAVMTGLDTILHGSTVNTYQNNLDAYSNLASYDPSIATARTATENAYQTAEAAYAKAIADYKATPRTADTATIKALVVESSRTVSALSDALRAATNFLGSVNTAVTNNGSPTAPTILTTHLSTLTGYIATTNTHVSALANDVSTLGSVSTETTGLPASTDPITIQSNQLSLLEKQDALAQAEQALADTVVRAPFSGTIGKLGVQQYQTIGSGTAVATLVSDNQSVTISVNEVDAAKLKVGEKATLTFDASPNVSIAGTVSSVNAIGTVSSGVVSYSAVITFDTPNTSVKPGMSATANIITGMETGLSVPSSAVKTSNGQSYVLTFNPPLPAVAIAQAGASGITSTVAPTRTTVTVGLTDNSNVIIRTGLSAGAQIVTQTITGTAATTASSAARSTSIFSAGGGSASGGGGGAVRALTR